MTLQEIVRDKWKLRTFVGYLCPISTLMGGPKQKMYECPFHADSTPSAKLHEDPDGEKLFCFACRKQFTGYDYIKDVLSQDPLIHLRNNFTQIQLEAQARGMVFEERARKVIDVGDQLKHLEETRDVVSFLDRLYRVETPEVDEEENV